MVRPRGPHKSVNHVDAIKPNNWFEGLTSYFSATSLTPNYCVTVEILHISMWMIVIIQGIFILLCVYTNIFWYSSIIYIFPCMLFILCKISLACPLFHPFLILSYATQCVLTRNSLYSFLWCLSLLTLLCWFCFLVLIHFFGRLLYLSLSYPFSESNRLDWGPFWDPFYADQFEFSKSIG